ncbi:MAG TPA: hypothetical protein VLF40_05275 [Candidatus Saccharimonadales bacterium]|nr:hypothetical protein [Candidatus Saccharimonadales bacterium]
MKIEPGEGIYRTYPDESALIGQPPITLTWKRPEDLLRAIRVAIGWNDGPAKSPNPAASLEQMSKLLALQAMERDFLDLHEGLTGDDVTALFAPDGPGE